MKHWGCKEPWICDGLEVDCEDLKGGRVIVHDSREEGTGEEHYNYDSYSILHEQDPASQTSIPLRIIKNELRNSIINVAYASDGELRVTSAQSRDCILSSCSYPHDIYQTSDYRKTRGYLSGLRLFDILSLPAI